VFNPVEDRVPPRPDVERPSRDQILVVDDEPAIRAILSDLLVHEGHRVLTACDGREALEVLERDSVNLLITDLKMPNMGGLELLAEVARRHPGIITLVMTAYSTVETAVDSMKRGAFDYVMKPFNVEQLVHTVQRGLAAQRLKAENIELKAALSLYRLAARLGDEVDLGATLRLVVETVREQVHADRVSLVLVGDEEGTFEGASCGGGEPLSRVDLTTAGLALKTAEVASDGRVFRYLADNPRTECVSTLLITPLMRGERRLGVLVAVRDDARHPFTGGDCKLMTILADRAAVAVQNAELFETLERTFITTIEAFVTALEEKDRYTAGHSERVAEYARATAEELGLSSEAVLSVYQGGRLHDIGKLTIRPEELNKPSALTDEEFRRFQAHPGYGEDLMNPIPTFRKLLPAIGSHHEKWDGTGYPRQLKGDDIPVMARIVAIADTYDAMTSHRAYRAALKHERAVGELRRCAGSQFDPDCVEAFVRGVERWREARRLAGREYPR